MKTQFETRRLIAQTTAYYMKQGYTREQATVKAVDEVTCYLAEKQK